MKNAPLPMLIILIGLTGCARHYVMKLTNGSQVTTASKPRLEGGSYRYKDARGEQHFMPAGRVREIAPGR